MSTRTFVRSGVTMACAVAAVALVTGCSRESGPAKQAGRSTPVFESRVPGERGERGAAGNSSEMARAPDAAAEAEEEARAGEAARAEAGEGEETGEDAGERPPMLILDEARLCGGLAHHVLIAEVRDLPAGVAMVLKPGEDGDWGTLHVHARILQSTLLPAGDVLLRDDGGGCGLQKLLSYGAAVEVRENEGDRIEILLTSSDAPSVAGLRKAAREVADELD